MCMKTLEQLNSSEIRIVLTDIDGTITENGRLPPHAYSSLAALAESGLQVIPVTGRPAGWCELIARLWPVHGVIGENGAFYFRYDGKMRRQFARTPKQRREDRLKLRVIRQEVREKIPAAGIASDQFCRLFDLAIDFSEDVQPLSKTEIQNIVSVFVAHGAQAKVSNIHVNGWFGEYDKVSTCKRYLKKEFGFSEAMMRKHCVFIGDSPNDEPMFEFFPNSVAVANIEEFLKSMTHMPTYVTRAKEADGFQELAERLLALQIR